MAEFHPETFIKIVADSVAALRVSDVFRVLDEAGLDRTAMATYICQHRPDLVGEVESCLDELTDTY